MKLSAEEKLMYQVMKAIYSPPWKSMRCIMQLK